MDNHIFSIKFLLFCFFIVVTVADAFKLDSVKSWVVSFALKCLVINKKNTKKKRPRKIFFFKKSQR